MSNELENKINFFNESNEKVKQYFKTLVQKIKTVLPDSRIELTGSRETGLAYPESDIDFAFIFKRNELEPYKEMDETSEILKKNCKDVFGIESEEFKIIKTKSGLPWCPIYKYTCQEIKDLHEEKWLTRDHLKLDITFRFEDIHKKIQDHAHNQMKKKFGVGKDSQIKKLNYSETLRKLKFEDNEKEYNEQKNWLKIL